VAQRRLIVTPRAQRQIARERSWWLRNRDKAPAAFDEELERGFLLLLDRPHAGHRVQTKRRGGARVIHLDRIRYDLITKCEKRSSSSFSGTPAAARPAYDKIAPVIEQLQPQDFLEVVLRLLAATLIGCGIGLDREVRRKPAGMRTHALVSLGAALLILVVVRIGPSSADHLSAVSRVIQGIIAGVGFLGGGAILKYGASIRGLTTAASMWVAAAVGLAVGLGYYWAAVAVTIAALVSLTAFRPLREWVRRRFGRRIETVSFRLRPGVDPAGVIAALNDLPGVNVRNLQVDTTGEVAEINVGLKTEARVPLERMLGELAARGDVAEMSYDER
jgi:putative Mg2+ transporter-C (MgtC) family protein